MLGPRNEIARMQSDFYRDKFRKILRWLIACVFIMFLLLAAIVYAIFSRPTINYYANTVDGKILDMPAPKRLG